VSRGAGPTAPALAGARVLVVGDEVVVALDLARTLRELGCAVLGPASEPAHALALLRRDRPDAVLLDLGPRSGLALTLAGAAAAARVPLVLLGDQAREGSGLPVPPSAAWLDKPFGPTDLRQALARLVGREGGPTGRPDVGEDDLHALVDGRLAAERRPEVEARLAARPDAAERVRAFRHQRALLAELGGALAGAEPPPTLSRLGVALVRALRRQRRCRRVIDDDATAPAAPARGRLPCGRGEA
jgi:two-component system, response regulator PdtaR